MSDIRNFVYSRLQTVTATNSRVFQQGSIITAQAIKPYLVYHFGNAPDEGMYDEDSFQPMRQYIQVYIHVDQGDYAPVDDIAAAVKAALLSGSKPANLIHVQYLETSQDLQDDLLQTFFRYIRFQLILAR